MSLAWLLALHGGIQEGAKRPDRSATLALEEPDSPDRADEDLLRPIVWPTVRPPNRRQRRAQARGR